MAPRIALTTTASFGISPTPISPSPSKSCATYIHTNRVKPPRIAASTIRFIFGSPSANYSGLRGPAANFLKQPILSNHADDQRQHLSYFLRLKYPMRSSTALAIKGSATVASSNTSAKRPPSSGGTNFPQETASVYVLPLKPPQWTGSGQIRTP